MPDTREFPIDLGSGYSACFYSWDPDLKLNPQYRHLARVLPVENAGLIIRHPRLDKPGETHESAIAFHMPGLEELNGDRPTWDVTSLNPLTVSPSILCTPSKHGCGAHGYIRFGRWEPC